MLIKCSNTHVRYHSYLLLMLSVYCYWATLAVNNDDDSNWEWWDVDLSSLTVRSDWFFLYSTCHFLTDNSLQSADRPTRNACSGRENARSRCEIRYVQRSSVSLNNCYRIQYTLVIGYVCCELPCGATVLMNINTRPMSNIIPSNTYCHDCSRTVSVTSLKITSWRTISS